MEILMLKNTKIFSGAAGVVIIGILSYFGYKVFKDISALDLSDIEWENIDDVYHYRYPKN